MAWPVVAAIVASAAVSAYSSKKASDAQGSAIKNASDAQAEATMYATDVQKEMFDIGRGDLAWARKMGEWAGQSHAGEVPGLKDYEFSETPDLENLKGGGPGEFGFDESMDKFEFDFDTNDEIFKWKQKETQRLVDQKMAAMGNMRSSANLTQSREALMNLMSQEVDEQYKRQWTTYQTNASELHNKFNRAASEYNINSAEFANNFNRSLTVSMNEFNANRQNEIMGYNKLTDLQNRLENQYWNRINTGLAGSGQSAALAQNAGQGLANTYMQGGQNQANMQMLQGQNQANYYSGLAQIPWQGMSMYSQFQQGQQG
jgi:hypothetical protein